MKTHRYTGTISLFALIVSTTLITLSSTLAEAQTQFPLFDKFGVKFELSFVSLETQIRLDSKALGEGTTLIFENDLGMDGSKSVPSLDVEWQAGRHHRLAARVQKIDRDSSAQTLTEIQWGDETIPVDSQIDLTFDIFQYFLDYTYYPWVKERWAAGVGLGLRVMDISSSLTWQGNYIGEGGQDSFSVTGPLPYLYFEYRRMFSKNWRFITGLGWLYVKVGDIEGGQWLGRASIEYQVGERWSFGGALNLASVDADWKNLERPEDEDELSGNVDIDIDDVSIFVKVRF